MGRLHLFVTWAKRLAGAEGSLAPSLSATSQKMGRPGGRPFIRSGGFAQLSSESAWSVISWVQAPSPGSSVIAGFS